MYALHTPECNLSKSSSPCVVKLWHPAYGATGCSSQGVAHQEAAETLGYAEDEVSLKSVRSKYRTMQSFRLMPRF